MLLSAKGPEESKALISGELLICRLVAKCYDRRRQMRREERAQWSYVTDKQ